MAALSDPNAAGVNPVPVPTPAPIIASAMTSPAPAPAPALNFGQQQTANGPTAQSTAPNDGYKFVNYNGQQVLGNTQFSAAGWEDGAKQYSQATGKTLNGQQYDAMINPDNWQARWNADGTPKLAGSTGQPYIAGSMNFGGAPASAPAAAAPVTPSVSSGSTGFSAWNPTPEQTVEGRIQSIINGGSPLVAQGRANAVDQMNGRGLANSSIAQTASDAAAYQAAIPIATADAATMAKAAGYNADISNQGVLQGRQLQGQKDIATQQADTQKSIAALNAETQKYTANLDAGTRTTLQGLQNANQLVITGTTQGASIYNQAVAAISQIQLNDKMDAASKTTAIAQIMQNTNNQLRAVSSATGVNVQLDLSHYPGFDAQGNYVGFGDTAAAAPAPASNPFANVAINTQ